MNIWDPTQPPGPDWEWSDAQRSWIPKVAPPTASPAGPTDPRVSPPAPPPTVAEPFMGGPQGFTGPVAAAPIFAPEPPPVTAPSTTTTTTAAATTALDDILKDLPKVPDPIKAPELPPPPTNRPVDLPPPPTLPAYQPPTLAMPELPTLNPVAPMPFENSKAVQQARINVERSIMGRSGRQSTFKTTSTRKASPIPTLAARRSSYGATAG